MGRINVYIPDDLEEKFRKEAGRRLGVKRGNLSKAFAEAVELWLKQS